MRGRDGKVGTTTYQETQEDAARRYRANDDERKRWKEQVARVSMTELSFYAWDHHCREMEPTAAALLQALNLRVVQLSERDEKFYDDLFALAKVAGYQQAQLRAPAAMTEEEPYRLALERVERELARQPNAAELTRVYQEAYDLFIHPALVQHNAIQWDEKRHRATETVKHQRKERLREDLLKLGIGPNDLKLEDGKIAISGEPIQLRDSSNKALLYAQILVKRALLKV